MRIQPKLVLAVLVITAALSTLLVPGTALAAGGFTISMGAADNPLHVLDNYSPATYVVTDIDGDDDLDVVARKRTTGTSLDVLRNDGGTFTVLTGSASPFAAISFPAHSLNFVNHRVLVGDFDTDGDVDLWHHGATFAAFYRNDGGTFSQHSGAGDPLAALGSRDSSSYLVIDVDGDGDADVVAREPNGDDTLELFRNDGGTFHLDAAPFAAITFPAGSGSFVNTNALVLDVDRDGDLDLWHHGFGFTAWYRNDGATFSAHTGVDDPLRELADYDSLTYVTGDVDSDGDLDVIALEPRDKTSIDVLRNDIGGFTRLTGAASPFASVVVGSPDFKSMYLLVGDHDADGDTDVYNHVLNEMYEQAGTAPQLLTVTPVHRATTVAVTSTLSLTFDEPVTLGSGSVVLRNASTGITIERLNVVADAGRFSGLGSTTITITPATPLPFATTIAVSVDPGAIISSTDTDTDAFAGVAPGTWRFATAANTPPALAGLDGDAVTFVEGDGPVLIDTGTPLLVTDHDGIGLGGGQLQVSIGNAVPGEDRLSIGPTTGIGTVTDNGVTISVAFGPAADATAVTALLRSLTYSNHAGDDPTAGLRPVTVTISDGGAASVTGIVDLTVVAINDPPTIAAPSGYLVQPAATVAITAITVTDPDDSVLRITAEADIGTFDNGQPTMTLTGSLSALDAAVAAGAVNWRAPAIGARGSIQLTVHDATTSASTSISLAVHSPPSPLPPTAATPDIPASPGDAPAPPVSPLLPSRPTAMLAPAPWEDPIADAARRTTLAAAEAEGDQSASAGRGLQRQRSPIQSSGVDAPGGWLRPPLLVLSLGALFLLAVILIARRRHDDYPDETSR